MRRGCRASLRIFSSCTSLCTFLCTPLRIDENESCRKELIRGNAAPSAVELDAAGGLAVGGSMACIASMGPGCGAEHVRCRYQEHLSNFLGFQTASRLFHYGCSAVIDLEAGRTNVCRRARCGPFDATGEISSIVCRCPWRVGRGSGSRNWKRAQCLAESDEDRSGAGKFRFVFSFIFIKHCIDSFFIVCGPVDKYGCATTGWDEAAEAGGEFAGAGHW